MRDAPILRAEPLPDKFASANRLPVVYPPLLALYYLGIAAVAGLLVATPVSVLVLKPSWHEGGSAQAESYLVHAI